MLSVSAFSLALAGVLTISTMGCGDGGSGGTGASGGTGGQTSTDTGGAGGGGAGGTATGGTGGAGTGGVTADMLLTSPEIPEGGDIPVAYTCAGKNVSPQLDWTAGPAGTLSYSIIFEDEANGLIHSAIWDISKDSLGLPTNVETAQNPANVPGATQAKAYDMVTYGYLGPCPGGQEHTYTFTIYALDVAKLPLVGAMTKESAQELSIENMLASAKLSAKSDAQQ